MIAPVAMAAVALAAVVLALPSRGTSKTEARPPALLAASNPSFISPEALVSVPTARGGTPIPTSFLGVSTEYWALPLYRRHLQAVEHALALLHVPGSGPLLLRVGGDSADHVRWAPRARRQPSWEFGLSPSLLRELRSLVRRVPARLILDLNVATGSARGAAKWVRAAERMLPRGSIAALEVGNEPDITDPSLRTGAERLRGHIAASLALRRLPGAYVSRYRRYARALRAVAPHIPLIGPALATAARRGWIAVLLAGRHPHLRAVSAHSYPFSGCAKASSSSAPTAGRLLNAGLLSRWAQMIGAAARLVHHAHLPFRLTELNSVNCGGVPGVSDSFATALWAPEALFHLIRAGVDSVNVHIRAHPVNAAFVLDGDRLRARPLLYGMALFARALGPRARLLPVRVRATDGLQLGAWAVKVGRRTLHVLISDDDLRGATVALRLPARGAAHVQRLIAPSVTSRGGVKLAGQRIGSGGTWRGRRTTATIRSHAGTYRVPIRGMSAALLTVRLGGR